MTSIAQSPIRASNNGRKSADKSARAMVTSEPCSNLLINADAPLELVATEMQVPGCIYGMCQSNDGDFLVTATSLGEIHLWDLHDYSLLKTFRDEQERQIDELFVVCLSPDNQHILAAGKRKSRTRWDEHDEDNAILNCHVKIFDVASGARVGLLEGHSEEVLCIKVIELRGQQLVLTGSQDGTIIKWSMSEDWSTAVSRQVVQDTGSTMIFDIAMLPGKGKGYFVAACDKTLKIFDLETNQMVQEFGDIYSSFCDCVVVVDREGAGLKRSDEIALLTRGVEVVGDDGLRMCDSTQGFVPRIVRILDRGKAQPPRTTRAPYTCCELRAEGEMGGGGNWTRCGGTRTFASMPTRTSAASLPTDTT